jgi:hypothetical protein
MTSSGLSAVLTLEELMQELKSLYKVTIDGVSKVLLTKPTQAQREILEAFNVNWETIGVSEIRTQSRL